MFRSDREGRTPGGRSRKALAVIPRRGRTRRRRIRSPTGSATRLYVDSLNERIDVQTVRVCAINNRVPWAVLLVAVVGSAVGLGLLAFYLAILARGVVSAFLAAGLISVLLLITFDLDRPTRGLVTVSVEPLKELRESMKRPPAAQAPRRP